MISPPSCVCIEKKDSSERAGILLPPHPAPIPTRGRCLGGLGGVGWRDWHGDRWPFPLQSLTHVQSTHLTPGLWTIGAQPKPNPPIAKKSKHALTGQHRGRATGTEGDLQHPEHHLALQQFTLFGSRICKWGVVTSMSQGCWKNIKWK